MGEGVSLGREGRCWAGVEEWNCSYYWRGHLMGEGFIRVFIYQLHCSIQGAP